MKIKHFIITRFSVDFHKYKKQSDMIDQFKYIPYYRWFLPYRFKLFEISCLEGIRNQTYKNFNWVIIIDKLLENNYREKLKSLTNDIPNCQILEYDPNIPIDSVDFLVSGNSNKFDYIMTTNLDDDDILPDIFVEKLHDHIQSELKFKRLPPIKFVGSKTLYEWDFIKTTEAPLGYKSLSHNQHISSCGATMVCKYPDYSFSILSSKHNIIDKVLHFSNPQKSVKVSSVRDKYLNKIKENKADIKLWNSENSFYDISRDCGSVLMMNHFINASYRRFYQRKKREKIIKQTSLNGFSINWEKAEYYIGDFKKNYLFLLYRKIRYQFARRILGWDI